MHDQPLITWHCLVCPRCASVRIFPVRCPCGYTQFEHPPGLGDRVAAALAKRGMTEERYIALKKRLGLRGKCGCKKRQQLLNRLG